jgi:hypothetical protein
MTIIPDNLSSDADCVDFDAARAAKDERITDPFDRRCDRASEIPITRDSSGPLFPGHPTDQVGVMAAVDTEGSDPILHGDRSAGDALLHPNRADIDRHLYALFDPKFVHHHLDARIEIAIADMAGSQKPDVARQFSAFDLQKAAYFAEKKNKDGYNVYVGPALRNASSNGRANGTHVVTSSRSWADFDEPGDDKRVDLLLKEMNILAAEVVETGRTPHRRFQIYVNLSGNVTPKQVEDANTALETCLGGDNVKSPEHLMRLAGTVNYPTKDKRKRGYVAELVTLHINPDAPAYIVEELTGLISRPFSQFDFNTAKPGRNDHELIALLETSRIAGKWHNSMRNAIATMIGRGLSDSAIRLVCAPYCEGGYDDPDLGAADRGWSEEME